ncbi:hypothetical protein CVT25_015337 [Psilocybe cyanescens]|uniref:Uncharacterized protein n=1 Tax=Psilocybe cyanescens TaxID=93625 RepID=A0A409WH58_PSICY|nr:hypothetical protein CVT25_015337 [Psilocybe cyanescens]
MSTAIPDPLAIELWLEILSYLPRAVRRWMIGVSRALFELALDDIYEEVRVCAGDEKSLFAVTQLQYVFYFLLTALLFLFKLRHLKFRHVNLARRVRRVVVAVHPHLPRKRELPTQPRVSATNCHSSPKSITRPNISDQDQSTKGQDSSAQLFSIARHTLKSCCNIRDLELVVNDASLQPCFMSFLKSLWHSESIGPRIRKLDIKATAVNLSALFELMSVYRLSYPLINIENLDLSFCHLHPYIDDGTINYFHIASFLSALEPSLLSFTVSGYLHPHLLGLLKVSSTFTRLQKLELHSIFNIQDLQQVAPLDKFIARHAETLEHIIIDPQTRESGSDLSSRLFVQWLSNDAAFSQQQLSNLRILELAYHHHWAYPYSHLSTSMFPNLNQISPNLTTLFIARIELHFDTIADLLARVPRQNGVCSIRSLKLHIDILTPKLMDLLTRNLPYLNSLEMHVSCASEHLEDSAPEQYLFCKRIRERKYPSWALQYLRITSASSCSKPHPNICIVEAVASTLSTTVVLGLGYDCLCRPSLTSVGNPSSSASVIRRPP